MIKKYKLHILFVAFLIILILFTYKDYGITWDENFFLNIGKYFINGLLRIVNINSNLTTQGALPYYFELHLKGHGVIFDMGAVFFSLFFKKFSFEIYHLIKALMAVPIFLFVGLILSKMTNVYVSLFSMLLLLLFPRFYGDIFNNPIDVPVAFCLALLVLYFIYFVGSRQNLWQQIILGLISAITINQRLILSYLFGLNLLILFLINIWQKKSLIKTLIKISLISIFTFVFMHLTHPYLFTHPIIGLYEMVVAIKQYPWTATVLFDGSLIEANELPGSYLLKSILITSPASTISLFVLGNIYLAYLFFKKKRNHEKKFIYLYFLLIFYAPLILFYLFRPVLYDGWRHFLFLTIPIVIMAGFGFLWITKIKNKFLKLILLVIIGFNLVQTGREMVRLHPYQYIYYNELVGGLKGAYLKYETDYWGAAYKEAALWFNKNVNKTDQKYIIKTEGDPVSSSYYFKKNMTQTGIMVEADYCISFTRWYLHNLCPGKIVYTVEREGVPLVFIKKIRE